MRRLLGVTIIVAIAAAAVAAWGLAAPSGEARVAGVATSAVKKKKRKLPPLPAAVRDRKRWNIGIKCDVPPFGYINVRGENAGFEVETAKWFSRYAFGRADRINYICAPTATREPLLTTGRADIVLATFTYTRDGTRGSTSRVRTTRLRAGCSFRTTPRFGCGTCPGGRLPRRAARSTTAG
jgi:ABC-type amino acid transport substrate-binding protein